FVHDIPQTISLSADLSNTNVEEMDDLAVVVFLQDNSTKQILQSTYTDSSDIVLGMDEQLTQSYFALTPNPTSGIVKVIADEEAQIQVFDLTGKNVFSQSKVTANSTLDLSNLGKGIFLVHVNQKNGSKIVKKLIIK